MWDNFGSYERAGIIWEIFKKEKNISSSVSLSWGIMKQTYDYNVFFVPQRRFEAIWLALWSQRENTPDFKWRGWSNGVKNQNPKKFLGLPTKINPQKSYAEFPSLKNLAWEIDCKLSSGKPWNSGESLGSISSVSRVRSLSLATRWLWGGSGSITDKNGDWDIEWRFLRQTANEFVPRDQVFP